VGGSLTYTSNSQGDIASGSVAGATDHSVPETPPEDSSKQNKASGGTWLVSQLRRLVRLVAVGLLLALILPGWLRRVSAVLKEKPWASLGWGALSPFGVIAVLVIVTIVILLIALLLRIVMGSSTLITMILGSVAGTGLVAYLLIAFYLSVLVSGYVLSELVLTKLNAGFVSNRWWVMLIGVGLVWLLTLVPILGSIIGLALALFGLGAICIAVWRVLKDEKTESVEVTAAA
jgi:hypothetical protein